jgi:hypothetical protein
MVWLAKGTGGRHLAINFFFIGRECLLVALQRAQVASILKHIIIVGEGFSRLTTLSSFPSLSFFNILLATDGGFGT